MPTMTPQRSDRQLSKREQRFQRRVELWEKRLSSPPPPKYWHRVVILGLMMVCMIALLMLLLTGSPR
jgi:hypothetical protein